MKPILYATGNEVKFRQAQVTCKKYGLELEQHGLDVPEIQAETGEPIALDKAAKAYAKFKRPVIISDDSWEIPGLNGFPGPFMKSMNDWLSVKDWLSLTKDLTDRRIILHQYVVYQDGDMQQLFHQPLEATLLKEPRGDSKLPAMTIASFDEGGHSAAELHRTDKSATEHLPNVWNLFAKWYADYETIATPNDAPEIGRVIELEKMLLRFRDIERKVHLPDHLDQWENDVEHSYTLALVSWYLSGFFSYLDRDQVIRMALAHDLVEIHAGDTFPYGDPKLVANKHVREAAALQTLIEDWPDFPDMISTIKDYESRDTPEAKFVYATDKVLPTILNLLGKGHGWRLHGISLQDVLHEKSSKAAVSPEINALYEQLVTLLNDNRHLFPSTSSRS